MNPDAELVGAFEPHRERLLAIATRVLGSRADAEDVVQEAWLRLARQEPGAVDNLAGWLTTVVGRLSIDVLRSRTAKGEISYEAGLTDLVVTEDDTDPERSPEGGAIQAESLGLALLVVLGALQPDERLAFVLHDMFAVPFAEIGPIIGKSADAAKMTASRARRKVHGSAPPASSRHQQRAVVDAFLAAARNGDFEGLLQILDPEIVVEVHTARSVTVRVGVPEVLRAVERGQGTRILARRVLVNGSPGILSTNVKGQPISVMACTVADGRMTRIVSVMDRARLAALALPTPPLGH